MKFNFTIFFWIQHYFWYQTYSISYCKNCMLHSVDFYLLFVSITYQMKRIELIKPPKRQLHLFFVIHSFIFVAFIFFNAFIHNTSHLIILLTYDLWASGIFYHIGCHQNTIFCPNIFTLAQLMHLPFHVRAQIATRNYYNYLMYSSPNKTYKSYSHHFIQLVV